MRGVRSSSGGVRLGALKAERGTCSYRMPAGADGGRWSHTPELGIFHATTDVHGNIMVTEDRIRYAYEAGAGDPAAVYHELSLALGESWDEELEPFRHAAEGAPVRWLHQVG